MHATVRTRALPLVVGFAGAPPAVGDVEESGSSAGVSGLREKVLAFRNPALGSPRSSGDVSGEASASSQASGRNLAVEVVRRRVIRTKPVHGGLGGAWGAGGAKNAQKDEEEEQQNVVQQNVYIRRRSGQSGAKSEAVQARPSTSDACCQAGES